MTFFAAIATSACCVSLPKVAERRPQALPPPPQTYRVESSSAMWRDTKRERDVAVKIYSPERRDKAPVVVFSHGIGEDRDSYARLGETLAAAGFMSVHITHVGTDRAVLERGYRHLYRAVKNRENWLNRSLDVSYVLDQLATNGRADLDRVAVAGHSAGAFTAFSVAGLKGGEASLRDPRVKVIVPMSMPRMDGILPPDAYDDIDVPVLNMTGTCDTSLIYRTFPRHRRVPFDQARSPNHHLVTIRGVNHDTFSAATSEHQDLIASITIAFLRGFLLGDETARAWFEETRLQTVNGTDMTIERK